MSPHRSRREFLRSSAALGVGLTLLPAGLARGTAANDRINVALVGVGGRGTWFVDTMPRLESNVVALCDVNAARVADAFRHWEEAGQAYATSEHSWERSAATEFQRLTRARPKVFPDFRVMLDQVPAIDAVVVATPDHSHAVIAAAAMKAGKPVFCEKPLTRTVHESRALRDLARTQQVATAMGNQGTYSDAFRRALELIRNGTLGEIQEVHVWNSAGGADRREPPQGEPPRPEGLDWDLWLGPAADRPFHPEWMQRHLWREFGTGQLGNWATHSANLAFMALQVDDLWRPAASGTEAPSLLRLQAERPAINRLSYPGWEVVHWDVPARSGRLPIRFSWHNGPTPGIPEILDRALQGASPSDLDLWRFAGAYIVGTQGAIHATGHNMSFRLLPEDRFEGLQRERPESVARSRGPEQDWLAAIRGGEPAWSNFGDYAAPLTEFLMLGNVATQFEGPLEFDPAAMRIVNNPDADALLRCEYRRGWSL